MLVAMLLIYSATSGQMVPDEGGIATAVDTESLRNQTSEPAISADLLPRKVDWRARCRAAGREIAGIGVSGEGLPPLRMPTADEMLQCSSTELMAATEQVLSQAERSPRPPTPSVDEMVRKALTGGDGTIEVLPIDTTPVFEEEQEHVAHEAEQRRLNSRSNWKRLSAGLEESVAGMMFLRLGEDRRPMDPSFIEHYIDNWASIESFAKDDAEVDLLREAVSAEHLETIKGSIVQRRERHAIIEQSLIAQVARTGANSLLLSPFLIGLVGWKRRRRRKAQPEVNQAKPDMKFAAKGFASIALLRAHDVGVDLHQAEYTLAERALDGGASHHQAMSMRWGGVQAIHADLTMYSAAVDATEEGERDRYHLGAIVYLTHVLVEAPDEFDRFCAYAKSGGQERKRGEYSST